MTDDHFYSGYNGFTIIEVALVLAIAGLIFLVVFLALPALQNSQKDTARREDVGRVISALQSYETDNGGDLSGLIDGTWHIVSTATAGTGPLAGYIGKLNSQASVWISDRYAEKVAPPLGNIIDIFAGSSCEGDANLPHTRAAVALVLSNGSLYCQDL